MPTGNTQQVINYGASANDGQGDPLRTAFIKTDDNFDNIWLAGPVGSNVRITNNTIGVLDTNGNLILSPNGVGVIQINNTVVPRSNRTYDLGSANLQYRTVYANAASFLSLGLAGDLTVGGNLTVQGNIIQVGNIVTETLTIQLANAATTANAANGSGITVGASDNIATLLYNSTSNVWTTNIGLSATGDVTANAFIGDGSQLLNIPVGNNGAVQIAWLGKFSNQGGTPDDTYSTLQFDSNGMPTLGGNTAYQQRVDYSPYLQVLAPRVESTDFDIVAGPGITVVGYDDSYNIPRSAYMSVQDQADATQQWDFGILGNGSNNYSISDRTNGNTWTFSTTGDLSAPGNVSAGNVLTSDGVIASGVIQSGTGLSTGGYLSVNGSTDLHDTTVTGNLSADTLNTPELTVNVIRSDDSTIVVIQDGVEVDGDAVVNGNISGEFILGNISQATGFPATYGNANVANYLPTFSGNISAGNVSATGNVTGTYVKGNGSELTNLPAPTVTQDITSVGAMSIMLYDGTIKYNNYATVEPASGNITAGNISTTGNIVANNIGNIAALNLTGNASTVLYGNGVFAAAAASSSYGNANVAANLAAFASNPITTTGNITAGNIIGNINPTSNINGTTANVTLVAGAYNWNFDNTGNLTLPANTFSVNYANGTTVALGGNYGNANVVANLAALGSNPISTTGNVTAGNIIVSGTANTGVYALDVGAPAAFLSNTVSSFTANVNNYTQVTLQNLNTGADATADFILTANNGNDTVNYSDFGIINSGYDNATPTNSLGNIVFAADTYLYAQGNTSNASQSGGNLAIGTTTAGKNVKIFAGGVTNSSIVANIANTGVAVTGTVSATGNISTSGSFVGNGIGLTNVTVSAAGNIVGTSSNVSLVAGSYTTTFDNTGNLTLPGNTFSVNYANNTPVNAVTRFESLWTVPVGTSTQSFTVAASETYYLWVDCNSPNGILVWNATATVTNTNVPVVGAQYAWVYTGGGTPIDFTSIPNQFVGTSNTIVRSSVAPSATTNRFDFGLNNTSGGNVTVRYGWIAIS